MIACRTLGSVHVLVDGSLAPPKLRWRKHQALLLYLACSRKRYRTREHLIGLLWPEKPESAARHSLSEALRILRMCAGEESIDAPGDQVRLIPEAVTLDVDRMEVLASEKKWCDAAALIEGDFCEGFTVPKASEFEDWLATERLSWRRRSVEILARSAEELTSQGRLDAAVVAAERALKLEPASDLAVRTAMRSLALAGDRTGALAQYEKYVSRVREMLGTSPDEATAALAERVRGERAWRLPARVMHPEEPESRRAPLVGREAELARLLNSWTACREASRASVIVLEGDPGVGKTRLADELLGRARLDGAITAVVRAVEGDLGEAWSCLVALARGGLGTAPGLAGAPPGALAAFVARIAEWGDRFPDVRRVEADSLVRALSEILRAIGEEQPLVLAVDDAHWADPESVHALLAAVRDLARTPLLTLFTIARQRHRSELDEIRSRIGRDLDGVTLQLAPLPVEALGRLVQWALPQYTASETDRLLRRLAIDSAGLPLLAVELLYALSAGLDLRRVGGAWPEPLKTLDQTLPGGLPDAVVVAIRVGFRKLSAAAQTVLATASILDERITPEMITRACDLRGPALDAALDELEWHRWLSAEPRGYSFIARIVRRVVARDMVTPGQRLRILRASEAPAQPPD